MSDRKSQFLDGVLGPDGAVALQKTVSRSPSLESAVVPRAIVAWLGVVGRSGYEGEIPGIQGSFVQIRKSETGLFSGSISLIDDAYSFTDRPLLHVAGAVAVSLGHEAPIHPDLRDVDAGRLGKSIDLLVKARVLSDVLVKATPGSHERPGPAHAPTEPEDLQAPTAPQKAPSRGGPVKVPERPIQAPPKPLPKVKIPSIPGLPKVGILKSHAETRCPMCRRRQFSGDEFVGCYCFAGLSKSVYTEPTETGYSLSFDLDRASVKAILSAMGVR